jgi:murein DD-endopeptidase MepM/ murein hydrolase activator NlpD
MTPVSKSRLLSLSAAIGTSLLLFVLCFPGLPQAGIPAMPFVHPITSPVFSSKFGMRRHPIYKVRRHHAGLDLVAPIGAPIRAIAAGTVVFADPYRGYGNLVVIRHPNGLTSHYGHLRAIKVAPGKRVKAGQIIATLGNTGSSTGPHLHLEIRRDGRPLDPLTIIPGLTLTPKG